MDNNNVSSLSDLLNYDNAELIFEQAKPFMKLMTQYRCAMLEIKTKLEVLNMDLSIESDRNPFESIQCRIKKPQSIAEKLNRRGYELTIENVEQYIHDVAGIRVICSFPDDIYALADKLCRQDDILVIERKDYIANPKPNGYRSLHLIVKVPVFLANETKHILAEVQFRTIAMDFWASLEHKVKYKKDMGIDSEHIVEELRLCAEEISNMDIRMQEIRNSIYDNNTYPS